MSGTSKKVSGGDVAAKATSATGQQKMVSVPHGGCFEQDLVRRSTLCEQEGRSVVELRPTWPAVLWVDLETRSALSLPASGAARYARDTSTEIVLIGDNYFFHPTTIISFRSPRPEPCKSGHLGHGYGHGDESAGKAPETLANEGKDGGSGGGGGGDERPDSQAMAERANAGQ